MRGELHFGRLAVLVGIVVASVLAWDSAVLTPFKLLAVMGHETGHALAARLVGGEVNQVTVRPNQSGECLSSLPGGFFARVLVYSGGYVGSALIAVLLLVLTFRFEARRFMLGAAAAWLVVMALFYGRDLFTL
ncbi:MAG: M50 family metallopeptidase, partial [Myxococcaceae bacterium]|nr:M50 family metallopeptidase [Myxococcaceae bacterium]